MFCKNCGNENAPGAKFCKSCGTPMEQENPVDSGTAQGNTASNPGTDATRPIDMGTRPIVTGQPTAAPGGPMQPQRAVPTRPASSKAKPIVAGIAVILVLLGIFVMLDDKGFMDKQVQTVRNGTMQMEPNIKIGDAFDEFFADGKWKSFKSTDKSQVVEFNGDCTWNDKPAKCRIQFIMNKDGKHFELGAVSINGKDMNKLEAAAIVDKALTDK